MLLTQLPIFLRLGQFNNFLPTYDTVLLFKNTVPNHERLCKSNAQKMLVVCFSFELILNYINLELMTFTMPLLNWLWARSEIAKCISQR